MLKSYTNMCGILTIKLTKKFKSIEFELHLTKLQHAKEVLYLTWIIYY